MSFVGNKNMKNSISVRRRWLLSALIVVALCACQPKGGQGPDGKQAAESDVAVPVEAATASLSPIAASYSGTAALEPENQASVVAKATGVLLRLNVEEGDQVQSGQVLAQLDPEKPKLEVMRAEANMKRLENDYRRSTDLFERKLTSSEAHERIRFDLETQRAAFELAKLDLDYTQIRAPISGVISERLVKVGNLIQLQQALFRIDDFDPLLAVLNVPERELAILKPGQKVSMVVDALTGQVFEGEVDRVSPVVDANTGTFRVTCAFRDQTNALKSGMFGRVQIVYDQRAEALVVPRDALLEGDGEVAVYVLSPDTAKPGDQAGAKTADKGFFAKLFGKDDQADKSDVNKPKGPVFVASRRTVRLGYTSGSDAEVLEGLKVGDRVVTIGKAALRDGARVEIVEGL
ncbi:efflux transporter periplasmic adaptor subunit [Ahniella affigens]|uniref:Efflux transporter periplasmic adaptor subunit n=2 Tax=Ahniella affigens TaxID=2021234 RepID=A0A2P1PS17_9GAMM|nr:efflux transporter periplasmic adaptor subunit [Ahniella affigens]